MSESAASNPRCYGYYLPVHCEDELDSGVARRLKQACTFRQRTHLLESFCVSPECFRGSQKRPVNSPARQRFLFDTVILLRYAFGWHERRASSSSGKQFVRMAMAFLGAVSRRARLGNGAGGLQREWRCLELFCARSRTFARLSLERGRHRGNLRLQRLALFRFRVLE